jgi:hypothetical protein
VNRRRVLSTIGSASALALAGCTTGASPPDPSSDTPDQQSLRVEDVSIPDGLQADLQVQVTNDREGSTPPALRAEMKTNTDQELLFGPYQPLGFPAAKQKGGDPELLLIPENVYYEDGHSYYVPAEVGVGFVPDEPQNGCWTAATDVEVLLQQAVQLDLEAGDSVANSYRVLNSPDNSGCFPTGRYRVEDIVAADGTDYDWGFDLVVE